MSNLKFLVVSNFNGSGKSTVGRILAELTGGESMDTSEFIAWEAADRAMASTNEWAWDSGIVVEAILSPELKPHLREYLLALGAEMCKDNPAALVEECLAYGANIVCGVRRPDELEAARKLVDAVVFVNPLDRGAERTGEWLDEKPGDFSVSNAFSGYGRDSDLWRQCEEIVRAVEAGK